MPINKDNTLKHKENILFFLDELIVYLEDWELTSYEDMEDMILARAEVVKIIRKMIKRRENDL